MMLKVTCYCLECLDSFDIITTYEEMAMIKAGKARITCPKDWNDTSKGRVLKLPIHEVRYVYVRPDDGK